MSKNKLRVMLRTVCILSVLTIITSCDTLLGGDDSETAFLGSSFTPPTGTVRQLSLNENNEIQISPWNQGEMTLYVVTIGADENQDNAVEIVNDDGTFPSVLVDDAGNFPAIRIDTPPSETLLSTAEFNAFPDDQYTVTPKVFSFALIGGFFNPVSEIGITRRVSTETNEAFVYWMYTDRDVVITGSKDSEEYGNRELITTNLNLKQGWNRIVYSASFADDTLVLTEKTGSEPSGIGWFTEIEVLR